MSILLKELKETLKAVEEAKALEPMLRQKIDELEDAKKDLMVYHIFCGILHSCLASMYCAYAYTFAILHICIQAFAKLTSASLDFVTLWYLLKILYVQYNTTVYGRCRHLQWALCIWLSGVLINFKRRNGPGLE